MERKNILIVDDELLIRDLLYDFFAEKGWIVSVSDSSSKALEILKSRRFDVALVDLKMPEVDGIALIKSIKAYNSLLPVVIITAFPSFESAVEALKLKVDDYITKPFNINKLFKAICDILDKSREQKEVIPTEKY